MNESYAVLIPEAEGVLVGMRARKTVPMRQSGSGAGRQHVTRVTLIGAHRMLMVVMYHGWRVDWREVAVELLYDLVNYYLVIRRGVQQAMQAARG